VCSRNHGGVVEDHVRRIRHAFSLHQYGNVPTHIGTQISMLRG
jgi:hypothetical protein